MRSCSRTMSMPVTSSLTGCSTCSRPFSSMKWKAAVGAEQELEGAGVLVADRPARTLGRRLHLLARLGVERRRRRLLDQLLVAPLDRALALAEREHAAVLVAEHLDLDVAGRHERLLEVERAVAERRLRLGAGPSSTPPRARPGRDTSRMPLPPPPATAFSSTGIAELAPRPCGPRRGWRRRRCPARAARPPRASPPSRAPCRPSAPSRRRAGPTKTRSFSSHARTKAGFSARKP